MPPGPGADSPRPLIAAAAGYAAAEILVAVTLGRFFASGRAEALVFLAFRPWLLIAAAAFIAGWRLPWRLAFYALALLLAAAAETAMLVEMGALTPWREMAHGLAAGALLLLTVELLLHLPRRAFGRRGTIACAAGLAALLLVPAVRRPYESILIRDRPVPSHTPKPQLLLMTALPIVWGERGAFDPGSRPAEAYRALQEEFAVRPVDALDPRTLESARLLLLAQPRWLAPGELVALDEWVRTGGRAVILTDPALVWPSDLPPGDVRRPPPEGLLAPLLAHWGLRLEPPERAGPVVRPFGIRRIALDSPGRFRSTSPACQVRDSYLARCSIGRGEVRLIADADLLRDEMWAAEGPRGGGRRRRIADNPLIVADMLDGLAGLDRDRLRGDVRWVATESNPRTALAVGLGPLMALLLAGFLPSRRRKR